MAPHADNLKGTNYIVPGLTQVPTEELEARARDLDRQGLKRAANAVRTVINRRKNSDAAP